MLQVVKHCSSLYSFAKNCAHFQSSVPNAQPSPTDLSEMARLAVQVVHMLEDWKRSNLTDLDRIKLDDSPDDSRPPKRPWEDAVADVPQDTPDANTEYPATEKAPQSTAEQDMELIRTKRASSTAGGSGNTGQPKSKYRKRSRATPPGKCHSCNIRETPEWRKGPDGARTLCNACGLHYAKLMRKKEKNGTGNSEQISLEDLRASARSGDAEKSRSKTSRAPLSTDSDSAKQSSTQHQQEQHQQEQQHQQQHQQHQQHQQQQQHQQHQQQQQQQQQHHHHHHHHHHQQQQQQQQPPPPPPPPPQHHQGSFQIMNLASDCAVAEASHGPMTVWPAPTIPHPAAGRYAPEPFHQSFMRSQHVVIPQASPR
ncbi:hypothetical protein APHAL10511_007433 [Amanita phalloides]|nr:hypothetical protein APHAL10511_007433 [Amanita phalloides]